MFARIYQPSKTAMSSGNAKTTIWVLEYAPSQEKDVDPLMGWTSSDDTQSQVTMKFDTKEAALAYEGGYGENFATNRRGVWTH
jgi:NADH dehydrogenase